MTERYDKEFCDLKKHINDVILRHDGSSHKITGKSIGTAKVETDTDEIAALKVKLSGKTDENVNLSKLYDEIKKTSSEQEINMKNEIQSLKTKLIVKESMYNSLVLANQTVEQEIQATFEIKYASEISEFTPCHRKIMNWLLNIKRLMPHCRI